MENFEHCKHVKLSQGNLEWDDLDKINETSFEYNGVNDHRMTAQSTELEKLDEDFYNGEINS